jgi:prolyl-tRNA synthetase
MEKAEEIYNLAKNLGIEVLLDDRNISPGAKFKDADLIGIPYRIVVGKALKEGNIEFQERKTGEKSLIPVGEIKKKLEGLI